MKNKNIIHYKFEDAVRMTNLCDAGNALLFSVYCLGGLSLILSSFHAQICGFTALVFFVIKQKYDWRSTFFSWLLVVLYLALFIVELVKLGLPISPLTLDEQLSDGMLLNLFIGIVPEVYIGLRLLFVFPLLNIIFIEKPRVLSNKKTDSALLPSPPIEL